MSATCVTVFVECFFFQAEDGIRDLVRSRGLGDVYKRQMGELKDHESCIQILTPLLALEKSIYQSIDKHHHLSLIHI